MSTQISISPVQPQFLSRAGSKVEVLLRCGLQKSIQALEVAAHERKHVFDPGTLGLLRQRVFEDGLRCVRCEKWCLQIMHHKRQVFFPALLDFDGLLSGIRIHRHGDTPVKYSIDDSVGFARHVDSFAVSDGVQRLFQNVVLGNNFNNIESIAQSLCAVDLRPVSQFDVQYRFRVTCLECRSEFGEKLGDMVV